MVYNYFMEPAKYTNEKYIPINQLSSMGDDFVLSIKQFRKPFTEVVEVGESFASIVETPHLVKERFIANMQISKIIKADVENHDYVLDIAKQLVLGKDMYGLLKLAKDSIKKYKESNNDLTIVTKFVIENIELILETKKELVEFKIPELSKKDIKFINKYSKRDHKYSINEYIKENKSSYETGRKAMEKMVSLQLYQKEKLGKKFIYSPTTKLLNIVKGGSYGN